MARAYEHWQEFYHDVGLMCRNAMVYNEDGSAVFLDAQQISVSRSEVPGYWHWLMIGNTGVVSTSDTREDCKTSREDQNQASC
jgi:hypothetical protein